MPSWTYRVLLSSLFAILLALGMRVVQLSQTSAASFQSYYEIMGIEGNVATQVGYAFEGLTLGILPVGTVIETAVLAQLGGAKALQEATLLDSWIFLGVALAFACVGLAGSLWPSDSRRFARCLILVASACMVVGQVAPIMSMTATSEIPVVGTSVVKQECKSILSTVKALHDDGKKWVATLLVLFSLVTPSLKLLMSLLAARAAPGRMRDGALRAVNAIGKWSMADVFVVALLLTIFSLRSSPGNSVETNSEIEIGFWFFSAHCLLSMIATHLVSRRTKAFALPEGAPSSIGAAAAQVGISLAILPLVLLFLKPTRNIESKDLLQRGTRSCNTIVALDTPGRILGKWRSEGVKHGGADDSLVYVTVIGPDHQPMKAYDHKSDGTFDLPVTMPGTYSIVFDNVGIIRATARSVESSMQFVPASLWRW